MGGGLTKAAIAMVDDDPALTAVIREALPQTVALQYEDMVENCGHGDEPDKWRFY